MSRLHVGIDWGMDAYSVANGQFRYAVDLLSALAKLPESGRFTVFGTRAQPPDALSTLFATGTRWSWTQKPLASGRGSDWVNQWRSFWAHRRQRLDVLHVIDAPIPALAACPVVTTAYDLMVEVFPDDYTAWFASRGYKRWRWLNRHRVARHAAISKTTAHDLERYWAVPAKRIDVVYLSVQGIPPPRFDESWRNVQAERFPALAGARFVLGPYNLEPRKNLPSLLAAFRGVRDCFPEMRLVLFGKGAWSDEREAQTNAQLDELGIAAAVIRTGFVSDRELAALYRAADVFAFPALYEGFGLPVLEAMACGGCVLARNASAMAEVIGDAGETVETADPNAFARALIRLLEDAARRDYLRQAARARAATFTPERMARETYACYMRALERNADVSQ